MYLLNAYIRLLNICLSENQLHVVICAASQILRCLFLYVAWLSYQAVKSLHTFTLGHQDTESLRHF